VARPPRGGGAGRLNPGRRPAHCPPELLDDLAEVLAELGTWPEAIEKRPRVFYVRGRPFLHFHLVEGQRRRADVKDGTRWVQFDLPRPLSATGKRRFLRELKRRYGRRPR
jgi:hypothetical protein